MSRAMSLLFSFLSSIVYLAIANARFSEVNAFSHQLNDVHRCHRHARYRSGIANPSSRVDGSLIARKLYKDNHQESMPPVYSSITSTETVWGAPEQDTKNSKRQSVRYSGAATTDDSTVRKIFHGFTGIVKSVVSVPGLGILERRRKYTQQSRPGTYAGQAQAISLVDTAWLKAHEEIVSEDRVLNLHKATLEWDAYRLPLLVDSRTGAILDGHHRYAVGRRMGLTRLPVILVDYLNDHTINVDVWPECGIDCLTKEKVIEMSLSDEVFPPKTSKHDFVSSFASINVPLSKLR